ncbi:MAG TPA: NADH-quinone oxidoreductase subunit C [Terriglobales bacterium]|nr:NADH-quinone oxidoreductase subunit C [Terriglobales bacterium]
MEKEDLIGDIRSRFPAVEGYAETLGDQTLVVRREGLVALMTGLRGAPYDYAVLLDLTCVDFLASEGRLEMVYHVFSLSRNRRLRVKVSLPGDDPVVDSLTGLWKNADWLEREVFDMFGVGFTGHPDLRRILMYEGFEGYPLRKSYPWRREQPLLPMKD